MMAVLMAVCVAGAETMPSERPSDGSPKRVAKNRARLDLSAPALDPVDVRWTFGAHEPMPMYRRMGRRSTGAIDGNARWTREWLDWFDAHAPEKMEEIGFNFIHSRFYKGMGWDLESKDFPNVKRFVANCHAHGVKTLAYVQFGTLYPEMMRHEIPEIDTWCGRDRDGHPNLYGKAYFRWMPCLTCRDWEDYLKRMCTIALAEGGFDGIMFDNVFDVPCHCQRCEKTFREWLRQAPDPEERFGLARTDDILLPLLDARALEHYEAKDPVALAWLVWRCETMTGVMKRLRAHIKSVRPDAIVSGNPSPYRSRACHLGKAQDMFELASAFDVIVMQNANFPEVKGGRIYTRARDLKFAQDLGQRIVALCDDVQNLFSDREKKFILPMIEDVVFGGIPTDRTTLFPSAEPGFVDSAVWARRKPIHERFNAFARAHRAELSAPTVHSVRILYPARAVLLSEATHQGIAAAEEIFLRNRVPYGYLFSRTDDPLTVPAGTEVVVVPGVTMLSDVQVAALVAYAKKGGRLVVTGDAGRCDEWNAQRRTNPLLAQLKGLANVVCREKEDRLPKAVLAWQDKVDAPTDGGRALMADLGRVGWQPPVVFENLPPWVFAEYRRLADGALAVHLVNYKPEEPVVGARVRVAGGAHVRVETPFGTDPAIRTVPASGELPTFAEYALVTVSAASAEAGRDEVWRRHLDAPVAYASFARSVVQGPVYDCGDFTVECLVQANGPGTTQRVMRAVPKKRSGKCPAVVAPFYFPEAMLGFDPKTGGVASTLAPSRTNLTYYAAVTYLTDLARRGYVAISADACHLTYDPKGAPADAWKKWKHVGEALKRDWPEWSGIGKLTFDTRLLVDLLADDPRVDADRIGIIGHSLGGKMAFYAGCLDPRIKVVVASDFGIGWTQTNWNDVWYWGVRLAELRAKGLTNADLLSQTGGKPFCLIAGKYDDADSGAVMRSARGYDACPERLLLIRHGTGHRPPRWAAEEGYRFLDRYLKRL